MNKFYYKYLFVLLVFVIYGRTLFYDFVWDDKILIIGKPIYRQFDLINILVHPYKPANGIEYLPVRDLSYVFDYLIWSQNEFGFHLTNIFLYVLTVILLYRLVDRLIVIINISVSGSEKPQLLFLLPLFTTLLFIAHPLHSQVVSFIIQRNTLLSGIFFISTLLFYLRNLEAANRTTRMTCLFSAFVCCLLSFYSKGTSIILPAVMVIILVFSPYRRNVNTWIGLVPFFVTSLLTAWLFSDIAHSTGFINANPMDFGAYSPFVRFVRAVQIPWFYLLKLILPIHLAPEYEIHFGSFITQLPVMFSLTALIVVAVLTGLVRRFHPIAVFAILVYFTTLLPVLNLLPTYPVVADRYAYLPSIGFSLLLAYTLIVFLKSRILLMGALVIIVLSWSVLSLCENKIWRNDRTLFEAMVEREPKLARGYACLGYNMLMEGKSEFALYLFRKAVELDPTIPDFDCQLGSRAMKLGDFQSAIKWFDKALQRKDTHIVSLFLCGVSFTKINDMMNASRFFARVLSSPDADPFNLKPQAQYRLDTIVKPFVNKNALSLIGGKDTPGLTHKAMATLYFNYQLYEDALRELDEIYELDGFDDNFMKATIYSAQGVLDKSLIYYAKCLRIGSESAKVLYGIGEVYQRQRKFTVALEYYDKALHYDPLWDAPRFQQAVINFYLGKQDKSLVGFSDLHQYPQLKFKIEAYEQKLSNF